MNVLTIGDLTSDGVPVLRTNVANDLEDDEEFLIASFDNIEIHITSNTEDDDENESMSEELPFNDKSGRMFVTTRRLLWIGDHHYDARVGYGWEVCHITLHAISRDPTSFVKPCLYCQIGEEDITEVRFVPNEEKQLQAIFDALSKSAEMNPDDDEDDDPTADDYNDGDGWYYNEDEVENGARAAQIAAHLDSMLQIAPGLERRPTIEGQFEDADEDDALL